MQNEFEVSTGELIDSLAPLVDEGRLTGTLYVDSILLMDDTAGSVVVPPTPYDEYGFSVEMSEYGAVRIEAVDKFVADWLANGDEIEKAIATRTSQYHGILVRGRDNYTDEQNKQIRANSQKGWGPGRGLVLAAFSIYGDRFKHFKTGETKNKLTRAEMWSREWRYNPGYQGAAVPNHRAVSWGNYVVTDHPDWEQKMTVELPLEIIKRMTRGAETTRREAEFAARNPNAKRPGR